MKKRNIFIGLFTIALVLNQTVSATSYIGIPAGMIHQAYVDYNDVNTVNITAGYGECSGNYWEITSPTEHDMTTLATGEDWHYVYIDDSASSYPTPIIIDSTTEPSWSDAKLGWYNGDDRCIGVIWSPTDSATILEFVTNSSCKWCFESTYITLLSNGNPNGQWQTLEATAYIPVNAIEVAANTSNSDLDGHVYVYLGVVGVGTMPLLDCSSYGSAANFGWLLVPRGSSRDLRWQGPDDDDNSFHVSIRGYHIER